MSCPGYPGHWSEWRRLLIVGRVRIVGVGFDGSPNSETALRWAAALCAAVGAELKVVHAVGLLEESGLSSGAPPSRDRAFQLADEAGLDRDKVEWLAVDGPPTDALLRTTEPPFAVDLLVVGTRGTAKHAGVILGSTSLAIAERADVPVVIVPTAQ